MSRLVVTIKDSLLKQNFNLDLPGDVAVAQLVQDLVEVLHWPGGDFEGRPLHYRLRQHQSQRLLHEGHSLLENGILQGEVLLLAPLVEVAERGEALSSGSGFSSGFSSASRSNFKTRANGEEALASFTASEHEQDEPALATASKIIGWQIEELRAEGCEVELQVDESAVGTEYLVQVEGGALERKGLVLYLICSPAYPHLPPQVVVEQFGEQCHDESCQPLNLLRGWTGQFRLKTIVDRAARFATKP